MKKGQIMIFNGAGQPMQPVSVNIPKLATGEILVRNKFATICGSDLHTYCGTRKEVLPTVLGHEIVGEVIGFSTDHSRIDQNGVLLTPGDIVTWSIFSSDPNSYYSQQGMPQKGAGLFKYGHAEVTGTDIFHGGFGSYCVLKKGTAVLKVPDTLPLPIAATINCAIATAAGGLRLAGPLKHKNILILGMGLLGLTCSAMCKDAGAGSVTVVDISEQRLQQASSFGADHTVLIGTDPATAIATITNQFDRKGFDIVFDMSGSPDAIESGLNAMSIGGIAVWIGSVFTTRKIQVDAEKIIRGLLTIKGLHNYNYEDFVYALDFITRNWNKYAFDQVVSKVFSLNEVNEAFEYALQQKPLRVGIQL